MKTAKYIIVFIAGFIIGAITCGEIYDYAKSKNEPLRRMFLIGSIEGSEDREIKRLQQSGAPAEVVNYQFDRMGRMLKYYHQAGFIKEEGFDKDMFMLEAKWGKYLRESGLNEAADRHFTAAFEYSKAFPKTTSKSAQDVENFINSHDQDFSKSGKNGLDETGEWEGLINPVLYLDQIPSKYSSKPK